MIVKTLEMVRMDGVHDMATVVSVREPRLTTPEYLPAAAPRRYNPAVP
jgi:hypothetical protein